MCLFKLLSRVFCGLSDLGELCKQIKKGISQCGCNGLVLIGINVLILGINMIKLHQSFRMELISKSVNVAMANHQNIHVDNLTFLNYQNEKYILNTLFSSKPLLIRPLSTGNSF